MKKQKSSRIGAMFRRLFNVRSWADWDRMKEFTVYLGTGIKEMFVPQKKEATESFEQAVVRLGLNEETLARKQKALLRMALIMVFFAALLFCYAIYQLIYGSFAAMIVSLVVMMLALTFAFRYHFWSFQIRQRKLGCSLTEWYREGLWGAKHE